MKKTVNQLLLVSFMAAALLLAGCSNKPDRSDVSHMLTSTMQIMMKGITGKVPQKTVDKIKKEMNRKLQTRLDCMYKNMDKVKDVDWGDVSFTVHTMNKVMDKYGSGVTTKKLQGANVTKELDLSDSDRQRLMNGQKGFEKWMHTCE